MKKSADQIKLKIAQQRKNRSLTAVLTAIAVILVCIIVCMNIQPAFALEDNNQSDTMDLADYLTDDTGLWYYRPSDKDKASWKEVDKDTVLGKKDLVCLHLALRFKKGIVTDNISESIYEIPDSVQITDVIANWLNDDDHGMNQLILGRSTPDKNSGGQKYLAGKYKITKNKETDKWELIAEWDPYLISQNEKKPVDVWADMYVTAKALKPLDDDSNKVVFVKKTKEHKEIATEYAEVVDEKEAERKGALAVNLSDHMTRNTGMWYFRSSDKERASWKRVRMGTVLQEKDLVCVHLAMKFKKGTVTAATYDTKYMLPGNIEFTDVIADWHNNEDRGMSQLILGTATPDNLRGSQDTGAGSYSISQNENTGRWTMTVDWNSAMISENAEKDVSVWADIYVTGKSLNALEDGSNMVIFSDSNQDGQVIATTFEGVEKEEDIEGSTDIEETDLSAEESAEAAEAEDLTEDSEAEAPAETATEAQAPAETATETQAPAETATEAETPAEETTQGSDQEEKYSEGTLTYEGRDFTVTASYGKDAKLPEDVKIDVREIKEDSTSRLEKKEYQDYYERAEAAVREKNGTVTDARFFDITFVGGKEEKEIEPAGPVNVKIEYKEAESNKLADTQVVHFADESKKPEVIREVDVEDTESEKDEVAVTFEAEKFSVYAIVKLEPSNDLEDLKGKSFCLINTEDGTNPKGTALMAAADKEGSKLQGKATTVRINTVNREDYVYVASNSNITSWTFNEAGGGRYSVSTYVGSELKYLKISSDGISLADDGTDNDCQIQIDAGKGDKEGKYKFSTQNGTLKVNGGRSWFEKTTARDNGQGVWMNFATLAGMNDDDFVTYTSQKVSISEEAGDVNNGDKVIVYTRIWNGSKYDYYIIDYDGKLIKAYEFGDTISWVGSKNNTMLWDFTEYYDQKTQKPNHYYELYNPYSKKYIAPKTSDGDEGFLADAKIGIQLKGRYKNEYYTTILAWDDYYYASLKVDEENRSLCSSTLSKASDFYFARMIENTNDKQIVTTVATVDNNDHGITLKMKDFGENEDLTGGRSPQMTSVLGDTPYEQWTGTKDLLERNINDGTGYPNAVEGEEPPTSLGTLFNGASTVNNQFLMSTYKETGYFEYDSTRNFAHLISKEEDPWCGLDKPGGGKYAVGDFVIYDQLGTSSETGKDTLRHGQFLPYNDLIEGFKKDQNGNYCHDENGNLIPETKKISKIYKNTTDIHANMLSTLDPNYGKSMYEIKWDKKHQLPNVDHFFGMEMSARFMQSENGEDAWGHDLIFEFSGDDDFWLYIDDMLVLDLGGIHSALDGNINFKTGQITENGVTYNLREQFIKAYKQKNPNAGEEEVNNWANDIFKKNADGTDGTVFKDYSSHTMRMFYLERGAGASNLRMRFNLSEYKEGEIQLEKKVSGTENSQTEFPFQIWYQDKNDAWTKVNSTESVTDVRFPKDPVHYEPEYSVMAGGKTMVYKDVFFLKAGQIISVKLGSEDRKYYIKECALDSPALYDWVKVNDEVNEGKNPTPDSYDNTELNQGDQPQEIEGESAFKDFITAQKTVSRCKKVIYENHVNPGAMKSLTITKKLWRDNDRKNEIKYTEDSTRFKFRVYIGKKDDKYMIYAMGDYRVKNPEGYYCYYYNGDFVSTGTNNFEELDNIYVDPAILHGDTLKQRCTFQTSEYGTIENIEAGYSVEIPGLMSGTEFMVAERDDEIPAGYNRLGYTLDENELRNEEQRQELGKVITGSITASRTVTVHNQHGYGLIVKKVWSDADFMINHDEIYFAVYLKNGGLVPHSVRQLGKTDNSLSWFFPELDEGADSLNDYEVYEIMLKVPEGSSLGEVSIDSSGEVTGYTTVTGETAKYHKIEEYNIIKIAEKDTLTAGGETNEQGYSSSLLYTAGYSRQELKAGADGKYPNIRTDTVTNFRPGIKLLKEDLKGNSLSGAVFTLSEVGGKTKEFTSKDGLIAVAYLKPGKEYTLKETVAPYGYRALIDSVKIKVEVDGDKYTVKVNDSTENHKDGYYIISNLDTPPTADAMPTVTIKNESCTLEAKKIDSYSGKALSGVRFALYSEILASGSSGLSDPEKPMPDYQPMGGYGSLETDENGIIPGIAMKNSDNPGGLTAGNYYLREIETPSGYISMGCDIRIMISATGEVTLQQAIRPQQSGPWTFKPVTSDIAVIDTVDGVMSITVKNTPKNPVRIRKKDTDANGKNLEGVEFALYKQSQVENNLPKEGETPQQTGITDKDGILNLGGLEGNNTSYYLFETKTLDGYSLLPAPVKINTSAGTNDIKAYLDQEPLECEPVKDSEGRDVWELTLYNSPGVELPESGGPGTRSIYLLGMTLVSLAGAALLARKRQNR